MWRKGAFERGILTIPNEETAVKLSDTRIIAKMDRISIVKVEQNGMDGVLVTFSDGTIAGYVVEELLELRPIREKAEAPSIGLGALGEP